MLISLDKYKKKEFFKASPKFISQFGSKFGSKFFLKSFLDIFALFTRRLDIWLVLILCFVIVGGDTKAVKVFSSVDSVVLYKSLFHNEIVSKRLYDNIYMPSTALFSSVATGGIFLDNKGAVKKGVSPEVIVSTRRPFTYDPFTDKSKLNQAPRLAELYPAPLKPEKINALYYPRFNINANIVYLSKEEYDIIYPGEPCSYRSMNTPLQKRVRDGIMHLYGSPMPGELKYPEDPNHFTMTPEGSRQEVTINNSYIVGHSSECTNHEYSKIFEPLERKSKVGDIFYIYDQDGRKLKFEVFDVALVLDTDIIKPYQRYGDDRVVTLQTSVFIDKNNIKRWITVGKLVLD